MPDRFVKVAKIKPFSLATQLTFGNEVVPAHILKLTSTGFLADVAKTNLKTGERFQAAFELPGFSKKISELCVVVKVYTSVDSNVIEGHFQSPSHETESQIMKFLANTPKAST